jgi:hypothetical protein
LNVHQRKLKNGLAVRAIIFGLIAALIYWFLPDAGQSAFRKMSAAMQNAQSWCIDIAVAEPTKHVETTLEFCCPARYHLVRKQAGGTPFEPNLNFLTRQRSAVQVRTGLPFFSIL